MPFLEIYSGRHRPKFPIRLLLYFICALLHSLYPSISAETGGRPPSQYNIAVCADDDRYIEHIKLLNINIFSDKYNITLLHDQNLPEATTYFAYFGAPELKAKCLVPGTQITAFLNYIIEFAPRNINVYVPDKGDITLPIDASSYETPPHSIKRGDDMGVYICYRNREECIKDLTISLFGLTDDCCRANACWEN